MKVRPLAPELEKKAREELGESPKKLEDSLQHLKEWIAKQPHLRARTDDQWLTAYLRGCKFSLERAKAKIDLTYTLRTVAAELYSLNHSDPKFKEILKLGVTLPLPNLKNPTDPRVVLHRPGQYNPNQYTPSDIMSVGSALIKIAFMEDDHLVVNGASMIMDLKGASMAHFTQMSPVLMKKSAVATQDAAPMRMKAAHYLNLFTGFETLFNVFKTFLNEKNRQRVMMRIVAMRITHIQIHVHGKELDNLYKFVPKEVLPVEYGGTGGTCQEIAEYWAKKVEEYGEWLDEDLQFGTDETLRPGKPSTAEDMFGVEGSFRQLEFD